MQEIKGKVAFITGGTKGIGFGIAQACLKNDIHVAITGRNQENIRTALHLLNKEGSNAAYAIGIEADVRNFEAMKEANNQVIEEFGKIDIVIANAGLGYFAPVQELSVAQWNDTIETNLTGVFYTLKATVDQLIANKGYFITISSLAGTNFFAKGSAYNASKFGVTGFTQAAMLDLRSFGVKVSTIMPGSVATQFNNHVPNEADAWKIQQEDIGEIVIDLLRMNPRTLPSKIEVRPSMPASS